MFYYSLDTPDYMIDPPEDKPYEEGFSEYELWKIDMELHGKEVPCDGDTIYIPCDDDVDCFAETWSGNMTQREYVEQGVCFNTANEAVAKAREDLETALYGNSKTTA